MGQITIISPFCKICHGWNGGSTMNERRSLNKFLCLNNNVLQVNCIQKLFKLIRSLHRKQRKFYITQKWVIIWWQIDLSPVCLVRYTVFFWRICTAQEKATVRWLISRKKNCTHSFSKKLNAIIASFSRIFIEIPKKMLILPLKSILPYQARQ